MTTPRSFRAYACALLACTWLVASCGDDLGETIEGADAAGDVAVSDGGELSEVAEDVGIGTDVASSDDGGDASAPDAAVDPDAADPDAVDPDAADPDAGPITCETAEDCPEPTEPCVAATCGDSKVCEEIDVAVDGACDDGDACTNDDKCDDAGACLPGAATGCDDNNTCTDDTCDKDKGCVHTAGGSGCDDGDACTEGDGCEAGVCAPGAAKTCDDSNPCTNDSCDPATGCVVANNTLACSDDDACTENDTCADGKCVAGEALACDDNNVCTEDFCDANEGCGVAPTAGPCDDGNACTHEDLCGKEVCLPGKATVCDDSNPCTDDVCDPKLGCQALNNTASCSDGSKCTLDDACVAGTCEAGKAIECDDGGQCFKASCSAIDGCERIPLPTTATCTDGNVCTSEDLCDGKGLCLPGDVTSCDDDSVCTTDSCVPATGCAYTDNTAACNDGSVCTSGDSCSDGNCVAGTKFDCDDGSPCTDDSCDPAKGCVTVNNTAKCDDNNSCTSDEACSDGSCKAKTPSKCDDGNVCTTESCDPTKGCQSEANTSLCSDGDICSQADACEGGTCVAGGKQSCSDGNACTDDSCDAKTGCVNLPGNSTCTDGNACTKDDGCTNGECVAQLTFSCDDSQVCTADSCDPKSGCQHKDIDVPCSDGDACTDGDKCANGSCAAGTKTDCDDGNVCTTDGCLQGAPGSKKIGCVNLPNKVTCNDGNACTEGDTCADMKCAPGASVNCDDKNVCTADSCSVKEGCLHANATALCTDDNVCTLNDVCKDGKCESTGKMSCNDGNVCTNDSCAAKTGCKFTANKAKCSDSNACTVADICKDSSCTPGGAKTCNDGKPCTDDSCDIAKGCVYVANKAPCSDGNACTENDTCALEKCVPGTKAVCNDGNPCTDDSCDTKSGCKATANKLPCNDGSACTQKDTCVASQCVGTKADCSDSNPCTNDACDSSKGCINLPNTLTCTDGDACTAKDNCALGACVSGKPPVCDDGNPCTTDSCDKIKGCVAAPAKNGLICGGSGQCQKGGCVCPAEDWFAPKGCVNCECNEATTHPTSAVTMGAGIVMPKPTSYDQFGAFVARSGDWMAVGAPYDDDQGANSGSVTMYQLQANGTWSHKAKLFGGNTSNSDFFGSAVAMSGTTLVVGANGEDDKGGASGAAYVFELQQDGKWKQTYKIVASDGEAGDQLGYSVAIRGGRIVLGAPGHDLAGSNAGAAYVLDRQASGKWLHIQTLTSSTAAVNDLCGGAVAVNGAHVAMGCRLDDDKGTGSGSVATFKRNADGSWLQTGLLLAADGAAGDEFGFAVAMHGGWLAVGAFRDDDKGVNSGSAHVYKWQADGTWKHITKIVPADGGAIDQFGYAVALHNRTLVIGAPWDDVNAANSGSVYAYTYNGKSWVLAGKTSAPGQNYELGFSVAIDSGRGVVGARGMKDYRGTVYPLTTAIFNCDASGQCACLTGWGGKDCATVVDECALPSKCDDGNLCTTDSCDTKTKKCVHTALKDGLTCGATNVCSTGKCVPKSHALTKLYLIALNNAHTGNLGGIDAANSRCQKEGLAAGYKQTWRAFLSTSKTDVKDLLTGENASKLTVYNGKNEKIFDNWNDIFDGNDNSDTWFYAFSGIRVDESTGANPDWFDADGWTGTLVNGTKATATCSDWTSTSGTGQNTELDAPELLRQETTACFRTLAVMCVSVADGLIEDASYGTAANPGTSCLDILTLRPSLKGKNGDFVIKTAKTEKLTVYCDMTTENGGFTYYAVDKGLTTYKRTDNDSCKAVGLQMVMPRSKAHWTAMVAKYGGSYFATVPGVYKTSNGGNFTGCKMRSPAHYGDGCSAWRVGDGGRWWLRDSNYNEPNGDYTANCWLGQSSSNPNDIRFNDGNCNYSTSKYLCSTNDKK